MANVKISDLTAASAVADANQFEINEAGSSKRVTASQVKSYLTGSDLDMAGNKVLFGNVYSALSDLPSASTYHGMFAHVHATGKAYFGHQSAWVELANMSDVSSKASQEKGTFTATCNNSVTLHSSNNSCSYIKTGDLVTVTGEVRVNSNGSGGAFVINNLPYASASLSEEAEMAVGAGRISDVNVAGSGLGVNCRVLTSSLVFEQIIDNATIQSVNASTNGYYGFTVSYRAA